MSAVASALLKERDEAYAERDLHIRAAGLMEQEIEKLQDQIKRDAQTIRDLGAQIDQLQRRCQSWERRALAAEAAEAVAEKLRGAAAAYRVATKHLHPCPETAAGLDAALTTDAAQARVEGLTAARKCRFGASTDDCCGGYCNMSLEDETPSLWPANAQVDTSTGEVLSLEPAPAAQARETVQQVTPEGNPE